MSFKSLTTENWLKGDKEGLVTMKIFDENGVHTMSGEEWMTLCEGIELSLKVPRNVRAHFEAVRGAVVYGYFFVPLYTVAVEQLHLAAEWAVLQKCKQSNRKIIDSKGRQIDMYQALAILRNSEHLTKLEFHQWEAIRKFRHKTENIKNPKEPIALAPGIIVNQLKFVAEKINDLFK